MSRAKVTIKSSENFIKGDTGKIQNTEILEESDFIVMRLHDHDIARRHKGTGVVQISTQGWNTQVTQRRLNGLLEDLGTATKITRRDGGVQIGGESWDRYWEWRTIVTASGDLTV